MAAAGIGSGLKPGVHLPLRPTKCEFYPYTLVHAYFIQKRQN